MMSSDTLQSLVCLGGVNNATFTTKKRKLNIVALTKTTGKMLTKWYCLNPTDCLKENCQNRN